MNKNYEKFAAVYDAEEIFKTYGEGSLFASGLIVDALHAFNQNLWLACDTAQGHGLKLDEEDSADMLKRDWVRRAKKFAMNYFDNDLQKMTFCLKDCYNRHKWNNIKRTIKSINFASGLAQQQYVDVDTLGSQACAGGTYEITF